MQTRLSSWLATFLCFCWVGVIKAEPADHTRVKDAVSRSLPYLEAGGTQWMEEHGCVSCHRVSFMTWAFNAAAARGFPIDRPRLQEWLDWSTEQTLEPTGEDETVNGDRNIDGVAQMLLGHLAATQTPLRDSDRQIFVGLVQKAQQADGAWKPAGQLPGQKRPKPETTQVSTMWSLLALEEAVPESDEKAVAQGLAYLEDMKPGKSTEWYAVRLLLADQLNDPAQRRTAREQLLAAQRPDGGWGWIVTESSDALATGQALYALAKSGEPIESASVVSARQFLLDTQRNDGSWEVRGTKEKKRDQVEETSSYWGTAWAVIGLLETLPVSDDAT